jgi:hypothetical protein
MKEHIVKCQPVYFDATKDGDKPFEVRRDDRGYQKGDVLVLQRTESPDPAKLQHFVEYDENGKVKYELRRKITWILTGGKFGIEPGYVVLALADET